MKSKFERVIPYGEFTLISIHVDKWEQYASIECNGKIHKICIGDVFRIKLYQ